MTMWALMIIRPYFGRRVGRGIHSCRATASVLLSSLTRATLTFQVIHIYIVLLCSYIYFCYCRVNAVCSCSHWLLLLLACAIRHHSFIWGIVLEPCSCLIVHINYAIYSLRRAVNGKTSTGDVIHCLFGTTITVVALGQSQRSIVVPNLPTQFHSLFCRV